MPVFPHYFFLPFTNDFNGICHLQIVSSPKITLLRDCPFSLYPRAIASSCSELSQAALDMINNKRGI
jgi:hypothetical protein